MGSSNLMQLSALRAFDRIKRNQSLHSTSTSRSCRPICGASNAKKLNVKSFRMKRQASQPKGRKGLSRFEWTDLRWGASADFVTRVSTYGSVGVILAAHAETSYKRIVTRPGEGRRRPHQTQVQNCLVSPGGAAPAAFLTSRQYRS
jgi:hypothetical protein